MVRADQFLSVGGVQDIGGPDVDRDNGVVWNRDEALTVSWLTVE